MDIEIKITPRLIERTIFIIVIIGLIVLNVYFYNETLKTDFGIVAQTEAANESVVEENKTTKVTTTTTIKSATTTVPVPSETEGGFQYPKAKPDHASGSCISGWRCYKPYYKGFVLASCDWINVQNCVDGCEDGSCK